METHKSVFDTLFAVNVNGHTEKKKTGDGGTELTYLSWPFAWAEVKKTYPSATYEVVKQPNGLPYVFDENTGYMVNTRVTINGVTHEMWLPVMDGANKAMKDREYTYLVKNKNFKYTKKCDDGVYRDKFGNEQKPYIEKNVDAATMFDVNKAIMRCLVKNLAMFGLGLYIYAGEDLPESEQPDPPQPVVPANPEVEISVARTMCKTAVSAYVQKHEGIDEKACWMEIAEKIGKPSKDFTADDWRRAQEIVEAWA